MEKEPDTHYLVNIQFKNGKIHCSNFHSKKHRHKINVYFKQLFRDKPIDFEGYIKFMEKEHCYSENSEGFGYMIKNHQLNYNIFSWAIIGNKVTHLLPAYNIIGSNFTLDSNESMFNEKLDKCIYRYGIHINERLKVNKLSKEYPDILDCKFKFADKYYDLILNCNPCDSVAIKNKLKRKKAKNYMSINEMLKYKIQLEMYGWGSFLWKLKSNCLVLKWKNMEEYTLLDDFFKPDIHYIHVDINNIIEKIQYYLKPENYDKVQSMIDARKKVFKEILYNESVYRDYGINAIKNHLYIE